MSASLVGTEFAKLRTVRTFWISMASGLAITGLTLSLQLVNAGRNGTPSLGTPASAVNILGSGGRASFVALVVGVVMVTSEFRHNTITTTLLAVPDRWRVLRAKVAAAAVFGLLLSVLVLVLCAAVGLSTGALTVASGSGAIASTVLGISLVTPLYAMLGVGIGVLVVKQTQAVTGALLWFLVGETLLGSYGIRWLQPFTPAGATAAIASDRSLSGLLPPWAGVLLLLAYVGVFVLVGGARLRRRSIT
jgi:ABC-type transport system involved in multi-copper enzyme maturation permease subunit